MALDKYLNLTSLEELVKFIKNRLEVVSTIPANPSDGDIILYKGTTSGGYIQGCTYLYKEGIDYYAWTDGTDTYYTLSETPAAGDAVYEDTSGTVSSYTISAYDATNDEVTINSIVYSRNSAGDVNTSKWELQDTSIVLNGTDKTGDEANFYAPTASGTAGQVVVSNGPNATPSWASFTGYAPQAVDNTLVFYYGAIPDVDDDTLVLDLG